MSNTTHPKLAETIETLLRLTPATLATMARRAFLDTRGTPEQLATRIALNKLTRGR